MHPIFSCIASLELTGEITSHCHKSLRFCFQKAKQPRAFEALTWCKIRCWMTAESHLRRPLIDFLWAPQGLRASRRSCSTCFAGSSIWRFTRGLELRRLSPQLSLLLERVLELCPASSAAPLVVPVQSLGPKHCALTWNTFLVSAVCTVNHGT